MAAVTFQDLYNSRPATRDQFAQQLMAAMNAGDMQVTPGAYADVGEGGPIWQPGSATSAALDAFFGTQRPTGQFQQGSNLYGLEARYAPGDPNALGTPEYGDPIGYTFTGPQMRDPYQSNNHVGRWVGDVGLDGSVSGLRWKNDSTNTTLFDRIAPMLPMAFAAAMNPGLVAGMFGGETSGAGLSAGAIEEAVGLPELGLATQTGLGGSMTLPTAGLGGLMEGVAPALPSGTGLGLTGGAGTGISGGALTGSPLLTGGGLASGLEGLTTVGGSSFGWLGDLAKSALGKDGWLPSVLNAFSQNQQGNIQRDWAERLYQDRAQFLQRLARTYTNPEEFLSGPEYQALSRTTLDQLQRQDAAKGRLATDVQRQKLMQDYAFEYLNKYRSGLAEAAGLTQTTGIPELDKSGAANIWGTLNAPLSQIARGVTNDSFDIGGVVDRIFNLGSWFE